MKNVQEIKHGMKSVSKEAGRICEKVSKAAKEADPLMVHKRITVNDVYYKKSAPDKPVCKMTADFDVNWCVSVIVLCSAAVLICCAKKRKKRQKLEVKVAKKAHGPCLIHK